MSSNVTTATLKSISSVRVGTVDSFQGQETEFVIFSAVRSNRFSELGFLRDPRRLCVALTRARQALILLGDSTSLQSCRHWKSLIESCQTRNCFIDVDSLQRQDRSTRDGIVDKSDHRERPSDSACTDEIPFSNDGKHNIKEMADVLLKPEEEFYGLFSTSNDDNLKVECGNSETEQIG